MLKVTEEQKSQSRVSKDDWREFTKTVWQIANVSDPDHPAVFPREIPRRLITLFSFVGERVLDPFGGVGTTALAAAALDRASVSVEQNPAFVELIRHRATTAGVDESLIQVEHGDARHLSFIEDDSIGLAVTSPPYWNKADYGDSPENLGRIETYPAFIRSLEPAYAEVLRTLAPGRKLCVVTANVNQHTDQGLLTFPLATDTVILLRELGFVLTSEIIWSKDGTGGKWGSWGTQRPVFGSYPFPPNFLFKNVHEYIIIASKPPAKRSTGKNALPYAQVMELGGE